MFPVSNLRDFYESKGRENVLGSGMIHDYNQKLAGDALIYGDIVRSRRPGARNFDAWLTTHWPLCMKTL
eukprot:scaffold321227_cov32-Tisochrysis_lutea.AAC.2